MLWLFGTKSTMELSVRFCGPEESSSSSLLLNRAFIMLSELMISRGFMLLLVDEVSVVVEVVVGVFAVDEVGVLLVLAVTAVTEVQALLRGGWRCDRC